MKSFVLIIFVLSIVACEKEGNEAPQNKNDLLGSWTITESAGSVTVMLKADKLSPDNYGFTFMEDGSFIERKNAGWCGTPPITYADFNGTWTQASDSLIDINVDFWGGDMEYEMEIVSLTSERFEYIYHEVRMDVQAF